MGEIDISLIKKKKSPKQYMRILCPQGRGASHLT